MVLWVSSSKSKKVNLRSCTSLCVSYVFFFKILHFFHIFSKFQSVTRYFFLLNSLFLLLRPLWLLSSLTFLLSRHLPHLPVSLQLLRWACINLLKVCSVEWAKTEKKGDIALKFYLLVKTTNRYWLYITSVSSVCHHHTFRGDHIICKIWIMDMTF